MRDFNKPLEAQLVDSDEEAMDAVRSDNEDTDEDEDLNTSDDTPVSDETDASYPSDSSVLDLDDDTEEDSPRATKSRPIGPSCRERRRDPEVDDDDDDVVNAILAASKLERSHPPDIQLEDFLGGLSFHPARNILAVGSMTGDVLIYEYTNEESKLINTHEVHQKSVRAIDFTKSGEAYVTVSKDKSMIITDLETEKYIAYTEDAHETSIYSLSVLSETLLATGDDNGTVKVWDMRVKEALFSVKEVDDYISCIMTNDAKKMLVTTSGDGYLTSINIGARKMYIQSEQYEEELTCMGMFRDDSKLVVGSSKGRMYSFKWDSFGLHSDMYPGPKTGISSMVPVTDRIAVVGGEEGVLRAMHVLPGKTLGVVGQHGMAIEAMDISHDGELIASCSHESDIRFWNIKYFEDFDDIKYSTKANKAKDMRHNLSSSKYSNASDFFSDLA